MELPLLAALGLLVIILYQSIRIVPEYERLCWSFGLGAGLGRPGPGHRSS